MPPHKIVPVLDVFQALVLEKNSMAEDYESAIEHEVQLRLNAEAECRALAGEMRESKEAHDDEVRCHFSCESRNFFFCQRNVVNLTFLW